MSGWMRAALATIFWTSSSAALEVGEKSPNFELQGSDGRVHRLADYLGKREIVLAWFPKAFTPG